MHMAEKHSFPPVRRARFSAARREFLITATKHATILAALSPISTFASPTPESPDFGRFVNINRTDAKRLFVVTKTLFPHNFIPDSDYANTLNFLDRSLTGNEDAIKSLTDVLEQLPNNFEDLESRQRETALKTHSDSKFFKQFRRLTIQAIYKKPENWQHFGYPGPSLSFGGWVNRELVDIDWLPVTT